VLKAASNSISSIPRYFAWSKYLSIYVFVVSLVNAIRKKRNRLYCVIIFKCTECFCIDH
jgi:hypothetical protein